jgi:hypothetical protein
LSLAAHKAAAYFIGGNIRSRDSFRARPFPGSFWQRCCSQAPRRARILCAAQGGANMADDDRDRPDDSNADWIA